MHPLFFTGLLTVLVAAAAAAQSYPYAIKTIAGVEPLGNGGPANAALLDFPWAVAVDASNNLYIADGTAMESGESTAPGPSAPSLRSTLSI